MTPYAHLLLASFRNLSALTVSKHFMARKFHLEDCCTDGVIKKGEVSDKNGVDCEFSHCGSKPVLK
jgi:hypothetical protein